MTLSYIHYDFSKDLHAKKTGRKTHIFPAVLILDLFHEPPVRRERFHEKRPAAFSIEKKDHATEYPMRFDNIRRHVQNIDGRSLPDSFPQICAGTGKAGGTQDPVIETGKVGVVDCVPITRHKKTVFGRKSQDQSQKIKGFDPNEMRVRTVNQLRPFPGAIEIDPDFFCG